MASCSFFGFQPFTQEQARILLDGGLLSWTQVWLYGSQMRGLRRCWMPDDWTYFVWNLLGRWDRIALRIRQEVGIGLPALTMVLDVRL
jgi:hypothetical protein